MTRREAIVQALLEMLATTPLHQVTTRQIAARVGLTQPALFRHFASRDAMLLAALESTAMELAAAAAPQLALLRPPLMTARTIAGVIAAHCRARPGVPRLLLGDAVAGEESPLRTALVALMRRQQLLVAALVQQAQARGEVPVSADAMKAGELFVAGMQGAMASWLLTGARGAPEVEAFMDLWSAGVLAGAPSTAGVERWPP